MNSNFDFAKKTVLVTGASMGIGEKFAIELTRRGAKVVLLARSRDKLERLASELPDAEFITEDLTSPGATKRVFDAITARGIKLDILVNNAGFGSHGEFSELTLAVQREAIELNVSALVELTHLFLPMIEGQRGGVINIASTAAFQPVPYMAVYAATKAFVLSFSEALWAEYRPRGVRVLALCPGATETAFFLRAGESAAVGKKASAEDVVHLGLKAFGMNRASVVHGSKNYLTAISSRFTTREFISRLTARVMRPRMLIQ